MAVHHLPGPVHRPREEGRPTSKATAAYPRRLAYLFTAIRPSLIEVRHLLRGSVPQSPYRTHGLTIAEQWDRPYAVRGHESPRQVTALSITVAGREIGGRPART
ncbi:hypothetical protein [Streptomyces sp. NPDC002540]